MRHQCGFDTCLNVTADLDDTIRLLQGNKKGVHMDAF